LGCYIGIGMKKREIARQLARQSGVTAGEAADRLDWAVHEILTRLRHGKAADLPGVGTFSLAQDGKVAFVPDSGKRHD
jgi:nucleoid DNA-binding protein